MRLTRRNFGEFQQKAISAIQDSHFIAIDFEMTGLTNTNISSLHSVAKSNSISYKEFIGIAKKAQKISILYS